MRILLLLLAFCAACAEDPTVPAPAEPVVEEAPEEARTAVTSANEANLFVGKLNWGKDPETGKPWTGETLRRLEAEGKGPVARGVREVLAHADLAVKKPPPVVTPDHLFAFAFCSRIATGDRQAACKRKFREAFVPKALDFPVERASEFATLIRAVDLFFPLMTLDEKSETRVWLHGFGDAELGKKPDTWRLAMKLHAAVLLEDERLERVVENALKQKAVIDWSPPDGWKPDPTCRNNRAEKLYGSRDFRQRDALLYHVYNLEAWTMLLGAKANAVDPAGQALVQRGLAFLKPYYTGKKTHREFVCTTVAADRDRAKAGQREYQQKRWKRNGARTMLKMIEPHFPEVRSWAKPALDEGHAAPLRLVAALQSAR